MSPATEKGYAHDWKIFTRWAKRFGREPLPASSETVSLFIADQLRRKKVVTVARYACGIAFMHRREGFQSPCDNSVHKTLRGARRMRAEQPRQMRPLSIAQLRKIASRLHGSAVAIRNRAILVLGFATAIRRASLASLAIEDVSFEAEGLVILLRREKQNREGCAGRMVAVPYGKNSATCPVRTLEAWLKHRGRQPGALFCRLNNGRRDIQPLGLNAIGKIVKAAVAGAGIDPREYGPHSLRSGFITEAGIAGASTLVIAAHVGHQCLDSTARYFRPGSLFRANCAALVGL